MADMHNGWAGLMIMSCERAKVVLRRGWVSEIPVEEYSRQA